METRNGETSFFDGGLLQFIGWTLLGGLVTAVTLGICYPWALTMIYGWRINHTVVDGHRMHFDGTAVELFGQWLKWLVLSIITLGIYGFWVNIKLIDWKTRHTFFVN
ncbi:YjgN family protein [Lapidilactobacillus luobeiensis]|uniref:YjgN family protein n=1 Tax=Lapidilactobacillus luobeiensis TaxID=2950371 RepID=UPI0021C4401C|nr:YjgN family protein [Lapidilactobacillus luobeiensis]